jgi:hypothetical protein
VSSTSCYWHIGAERTGEFLERGFKKRHVFPHRMYYLPKCGPDGFKLANWMCGPCRPDQLWELVLYADDAVVAEFPRELFFDDDVVWHQQQFGKSGQIATADLAVVGRTVCTAGHVSDVFQRISRRREYKTRIETKLQGWTYLVVNGILNFALERDLDVVRTPTAALALRHTDPQRQVDGDIFDRIYDLSVRRIYRCREESGWWTIPLEDNRDRIVRPVRHEEPLAAVKTICVCHDIERGLGHRGIEPAFARHADQVSPGHLARMLDIEAAAGVRATYNVVGAILPEVRGGIEAGGHCLGFHSFDHTVDAPDLLRRVRDRVLGRTRSTPTDQLPRCRKIDYRIKGYRPPQSRVTPELSDENLCHHNFEWLAVSEHYLQIAAPEMRNRIVRIPIAMDDFDLHRTLPYDRWEARLLEKVWRRQEFTAISLHDCYGDRWLPNYERLLEKLRPLGTFKTLDEVAAGVCLENAV